MVALGQSHYVALIIKKDRVLSEIVHHTNVLISITYVNCTSGEINPKRFLGQTAELSRFSIVERGQDTAGGFGPSFTKLYNETHVARPRFQKSSTPASEPLGSWTEAVASPATIPNAFISSARCFRTCRIAAHSENLRACQSRTLDPRCA